MRTFLLLLFLPFCGAAQVMAQSEGLRYLTLSDSLREGANSVVLSVEEEYTATSRNTAVLHRRRAITLLNGKAKAEKVLTEFYNDDSKITTFEMTVFDAAGNETYRARKKDLSDQRYDDDISFLQDMWIKSVKAPCDGYPCTIVTEVEKEVKDFAAVTSFPHWIPVGREQSLLSGRLRVNVPVDNELLFEGKHVADPTVTDDGKVRTYAWELTNIPAQPEEALAPSYSETLPYVRTELADFEMEGYAGSYRSWQSFGAFMNQLLEGRAELPPILTAAVHEAVDGVTDEAEKIDRLYRLLQERCRYVSIQLGIGGWQPFSAAYVEENRFGDCKALSNFMGAMLKEVGIASYPVLIMWDEKPYYSVHSGFASSAFNHMVLYIPSQDMYLECTSKYAPTGYLGEGKQDRNVLWVTPEGGQLVRTPALKPGENGHLRTTSLTFTEHNNLDFSMAATYYGAAQETFRQLGAYRGDRQDQLDWLHHNDFLPDVTGSNYEFAVSTEKPEVSLAYQTVLRDKVASMGSRKFVTLNPFPISWIPEQTTSRSLPIDYSKCRFYVDTVRLTLPPEMEIESGLMSEPLVYSQTVGEYRADMHLEDNEVVWTRTLKLQPARLEPEAYAEFRQFFVDVAKAENLRLVLRERRTK
ncbi:DUF3857 domain-containing protein [Lewinella sp. IMCC34191]|uniref:DUF3857 domain-containing protein n=1 Tax=Lewinella sp. IMCC34191 TaxID=2259172 RepID=UPI000E27BD34|nr:DUF3857 domain-containing protein [Lewinella sp. IMCC34191]